MNDRIKKYWVLGIVSSIGYGVFWFVHTFTENIVGSISITACAGIGIASILYILGKAKKS